MNFHKIPTGTELLDILEKIASEHPDLVTIIPLTNTPAGTPVLCIELAANKQAHSVAQRPGFLIQGNLHAIEYAGCIQSLHLLEHFTSSYTSNPRIKTLLDEHVVYIIPRVDMDGADYILTTGHRIRNRIPAFKEQNVPFPEDLNGDGKILTMRWQSPDGNFRLSDKDPRLLLPRQPTDTEGPFYHQATEGLIHEWDGRNIHSSRARCDFNRNFPANWKPNTRSLGWGPYPLSESETRAIAEFILSHPNILGVADFHTGNPAIFYPSTVIENEARYPEDATLLRRIGKAGEESTGFQYLSGYSEGWTGKHTESMPGSFLDWLYEHAGLIPFIIEMGMHYNYLGLDELQRAKPPDAREEIDGLAQLQWNDEHPDQKLFTNWKSFDHPQLGPIEIGGWNYILWSNPPPDEMEAVCQRCTEFVLHHATHRPRIEISETTLTPLGNNLYKLIAEIRNIGSLPTSITRQGQDTHPYSKPQALLSGPEDLEIISGTQNIELEHLSASTGKTFLEWVVRTNSPELTLEITSKRGIYAQKTILISDK